MVNNIVKKQNEPKSLEKLGAQNSIYREAKQYSICKLYICVFSVIIFTYVGILVGGLNSWIAFYSVLVGFVAFILDKKICSLKVMAAKIQNMFDLYLYQIKWDSLSFGKKPEHEVICRYNKKYLKKYKGDISKLINWYEVAIDNVPFDVARLICQKSNCRYDCSLRKKLNCYIYSIFTIASLLIIITLFYNDLNIKNLFTLVLAPLFPIIQWGCSSIHQQKDALVTNEELNSHINDSWDLVINREHISNERIEKLQSVLYHYRCVSPLIPDWFYYKYRNEKEDEINYTVDNLIEEYNRSIIEL